MAMVFFKNYLYYTCNVLNCITLHLCEERGIANQNNPPIYFTSIFGAGLTRKNFPFSCNA